MLTTRSFAWWPIVAWQLHVSQGKVQLGSLSIGGPEADKRWRYISKYGFGLGVGKYDVRVRLRQPTSLLVSTYLDLDIYLDEDWHRVQSLPSCKRESYTLSRKTLPLKLEASGDWGDWQAGAVEHRVRPHIWYFALSDCDHVLTREIEVDFEFRARQETGSEFSVEARYMLLVHSLMLLCCTAFLFSYIIRCHSLWQRAGALHPMLLGLTAAIGLQYAAQILYTLHLWRYRENGVGVWTLSAVSENLSMASQVMHTALLIIIARGYTLLCSKAAELGFTKPIIAAVLLTHSALVGFGKLEDDASYKHHENEGVVGWAILVIRLILLTWFLRAARASQEAGGLRVSAFLRQFQLAGSVYFLAYPVLLLLVQVFAPYLRHPILQVGVLVMQLASDAWLSHLFLSRGTYFELSTLSAPLLPSFGPSKMD